ncbi:MAG TPA: ABC transporter permease [Acidobacteriaceae bacterium]|nr:ABC transporter permease [Acidobacteriaceae bacterium]
MQTFLQDFRYSLRQLIKNPGFALTAVLSLALGIGATVSVFSVIYGVLMHPFPYTDVERIGNLSIRDSRGILSDAYFTGPQLRELRKVHAFESFATWRPDDLRVTGEEIPEAVSAFYGIGETFPTLGVPALLGRNLGPSDSPDGQEPQPVVMLHYRFWQRHFHGDPAIVGKTLELGRKKYTIIGVTRSNFTWDWGADVYLPQEIADTKGGGVVVKLRSGVSWATADAEMTPLLRRFAQEHPDNFPRTFKVDIRPLTYETTQNIGSTLYLLFAAVSMLLAIGCGNVSILLLARGTARQHEFAVRAAVGASSIRIVRQLLTESLLLAITGTGLGILFAYRLLALIVAWMPERLFPPDVAIRINAPVLLFSAGLALAITVLFGMMPALRMAKPEIGQVMQSNSIKAAGSVRGKRLHGSLVAAQIALTLLLLTAAGAAIQGFVRLTRVPLGYDPHNVVSMGIQLQENSYTTWQARVNYFEQLRDSVATLPDVASAAIDTNATPPYSGWQQSFELLGTPAASPEAQTARVGFVGPGFFRTLHMPLVEGRIWDAAEVSRGALLVLVNQSFVRRYFPNGDAIGHSLKLSKLSNNPPKTMIAPGADGWLQVIGVVGDAVNDGIENPVKPAIFAPYSLQMWAGTGILIRSSMPAEALVHVVRVRLAALNRDQLIAGSADLERWLKREPVWARGKLISALFAGFSILALVLSAVGLYSVVSYSVMQRTNEFGIRIALGARRLHVFRIVMTSAAVSVGIGVVAGVALSMGLNRFIADWVGNSATHPLMVTGVSLLLLAVAAAACVLPARRALSVDPMTALRRE